MSIVGIGTDLIELARIEAAMARHCMRFVQRILGEAELVRFAARNARCARRGAAFVATRFAAKEAISKALGLGMVAPMGWHAVEVVNAPSGAPRVLAHAALSMHLQARRLRLHISLTDEREMAMAYAIAEEIS